MAKFVSGSVPETAFSEEFISFFGEAVVIFTINRYYCTPKFEGNFTFLLSSAG
jgi:hypothetical protein